VEKARRYEAGWWLATDDYSDMMGWLGASLSRRKRILFGCATARLVWDHVTRPANRAAIETAERRADGSLPRKAFADAWMALEWEPAMWTDWNIVALTDGAPYREATREEQRMMTENPFQRARSVTHRLWSDALRDIVGDPFHPVAIDPAWLAGNDGIAVKLAAAIYEERRFADLPVLADALEDGGCASAELLGHLRAPGTHFRGCWALDLVLGRS
jgi:hypothetical protein